jgi:hypothetical protein
MLTEDKNDDKNKIVTMQDVRDEIAFNLKKLFRIECCPNCGDVQSMAIVFTMKDKTFGTFPSVSESYRCPKCLKLFESKMEEVPDKAFEKTKIKELGFGNPIKKRIEESKKPMKQEEEN